MKKIILLLFLLTSCGVKQNETPLVCIQINDRNGLKETISSKKRLERYRYQDFLSQQPYKNVVRIYKDEKTDKRITKLTSYHENGLIFQYLEALNSRAFGKYKQWHDNGSLAVEANIIGGPATLNIEKPNNWIFDKECIAYDEMGNKVSKFLYDKGKIDGEAFYYYSNGSIKENLTYRKNKLNTFRTCSKNRYNIGNRGTSLYW